MSASSAPTVSVVIPAYQSGRHIGRCLEAIAASTLTPLETIVVDDGSSDDTGTIGRSRGATVLSTPGGPRGPAAARNLGVALARGEILCFLDADVAVHPDALAQLAGVLTDHADVAAVFGSYDAAPDEASLLSRYRNLMHHWVHQHGSREAATFWAGCGAIRRSVFNAVGGFDERFARPSVEDIEFGGRLRRAGHRAWLCPDIQATHLKRWTFASILICDIRDRAIPWSRLIASGHSLPRDLNTDLRSRVSALAVWVGVVAAAATPWAGAIGLQVAAVSFGIQLVLNGALYRFFRRHGGVWLALAGAGMHTLYFLYSSAVFALVFGWHALGLRGFRRIS